MSFTETSAKNNTNVEETIESIMLAIIKKGLMEMKKEKVVLAGKQEGSRKEENDTCCGWTQLLIYLYLFLVEICL